MGMFDVMSVPIDVLPELTQEERDELNRHPHEWQTKSFYRELSMYEITRQMELKHNNHLELDHDRVNFYTMIHKSNKWYEFNAWVSDGRIFKIERVHERR